MFDKGQNMPLALIFTFHSFWKSFPRYWVGLPLHFVTFECLPTFTIWKTKCYIKQNLKEFL